MAVTDTAEKSTLAVRIRNGQSTTGEWRYKYVNIPSVRADFGTQNDDTTKAVALGELLKVILVGTADGLRWVKTSTLIQSA